MEEERKDALSDERENVEKQVSWKDFLMLEPLNGQIQCLAGGPRGRVLFLLLTGKYGFNRECCE